ncbi:ABC transporter ATP-binding protein [Vagococcus jeotgali]|uniref:ABC transporter ATP-binding protein n=1 Tax=Vagococcus jeotgali TaxID=3109030 RepID=UPI002DDAFD12|nr:ABC transporter ATP-binding protein [Vagococcus sp. B2T-5]
MTLLQVDNIKKTYHTRLGGKSVEALKHISFTVESGEYVSIMGESGSGKSTLLNLLATLDTPTSGEILLNGENTSKISEKDAALFRRQHLGFVFQDFNLLDNFSVKDNILLPLVLAKTPVKDMEKRLDKLAPKIGLDTLLNNYPYELSGGQKQRVASARAIITNPDLLLADEPTGALDSKTSSELLDLFHHLNEEGQTILMVTHSAVAASHSSRVLFIKDGKVFHQVYRGERTQEEFLMTISESMTVLLQKEG